MRSGTVASDDEVDAGPVLVKPRPGVPARKTVQREIYRVRLFQEYTTHLERCGLTGYFNRIKDVGIWAMPAKTSRRQVSTALRGADQIASRQTKRSARSQLEAEIAVLNERIQRNLIELQIRADRLLAK
jgi:hypothetical protein